MSLKDKIIAFDLDGTLAHSNTWPSEYTYNEISRLIEEGYHLTIITGRAPISSKEIYDKCHMNMLSVHNNGTLVYDFKTESKKVNITIPPQVIDDILNNEELMQYVNDIVIEINYQAYSFFGNVVWNNNVIIGDFRDKIQEQPNSLIFYANAPELQKNIYEIINKSNDYHYRYWYLQGEFYNLHYSKKEGAEELLKQYGKSFDDLIYFGDAENDNELLEAASIGVAMKNATEDVKAHANLVTDFTNEEDGAIKYLIKMIEDETK